MRGAGNAALLCLAVGALADYNGTCPSDSKCPASAGADKGLPCCQISPQVFECCYSAEACIPKVGCRCAAEAGGACSAEGADLTRARTPRPPPGSPVAASSTEGIFRAVDAHLSGSGHVLRPCSEWAVSDLEALAQFIIASRDPRLNRLYEGKSDRRTLRAAAGRAAGGAADQALARDGLCAEAVMLWAHHTSHATRQRLRATEGFALPTMPAEARDTDDVTYRSQVVCSSCHYSSGPATDAVAPARPVGAPAIPMWGGAKQFSVEVNMTDVSDAPEHPQWRFRYFYNADLHASRYEHLGEQWDEVCGPSRTGKPCTVIFASSPHATYLVNDEGCCKHPSMLYNAGAVRSDWLATDATYQGNTTVRGYPVTEWLKYGASDNHYYSTKGQSLPVRYMEHKNSKLKQWDFDLATYKAGPQPASLFEPPAGCTSTCA